MAGLFIRQRKGLKEMIDLNNVPKCIVENEMRRIISDTDLFISSTILSLKDQFEMANWFNALPKEIQDNLKLICKEHYAEGYSEGLYQNSDRSFYH